MDIMLKMVNEYLDYLKYQKNYSELTIESYHREIQQFVDFLLREGIDSFDKVEYSFLRGYLMQLHNLGLSASTINHKLTSLRSFYRFLQKEEYVSDNPFLLIESLKMPQKNPDFLYVDEMIELFKEYNVNVSTSIDGSEIIHNHNRKYKDGTGTYKKVVSSVERLRKKGVNVGAIETTTRNSLQHPEDIVKTYVELGFDSIFIRPLTQLGKATKNWLKIGYTAEEFIEFYKRAIDELIKINLSGKYIKEEHCSILLRRIYGRFINYMELRTPCGADIGQLDYYQDGNIFTCDEGRMFYEMGHDTFCLGNVFKSNHKNMMKKNECKAVCAASILEAIPNCCDCVYQPYCGTCPVINYALTKDIIE